MNTLTTQLRKFVALFSVSALLSTLVVVAPASAAWYDSAVNRLGDGAYQSMTQEQKEALLSATSSRQDAAVVIHRALGSKVASAVELPFSDAAEIAAYALPAVQSLYEDGVVKGNDDGTFKPNAPLNRAEVVVMLDRAGLLGTELADTTPAIDAEFAEVEWAKTSFRKAAAAGVLQGYPDGTWRPGGAVNKAETFVFADRATSDGSTSEKEDTTLKGGAGDVTVTSTATGVKNKVNEGEEEKVLGVEVKAIGSDVALSFLKVAMNKENNNGSSRPDKFMSTVTAYLGNTEIGSLDVSSLDKDGQVYSGTINLSNAVVRMNQKERLYLAVEAKDPVNHLGADFKIELDTLRFEDATSVISTSKVELINNTFGFKEAGSDDKLTVRAAANDVKSSNLKVEENSSSEEHLLGSFELKTGKKSTKLSLIELPVQILLGNVDANLNGVVDVNGDVNVNDEAKMKALYDMIVDEVVIELDGERYTGVYGNALHGLEDGGLVDEDRAVAEYNVSIDGDVEIKADSIVKGKVLVTFREQDGVYNEGLEVATKIVGADLEFDGQDTGNAAGTSYLSATHVLKLEAYTVKFITSEALTDSNNLTGVISFKVEVEVEEGGPVTIDANSLDVTHLNETLVPTLSIVKTKGNATKVGADSYEMTEGQKAEYLIEYSYISENENDNGYYRISLNSVLGVSLEALSEAITIASRILA